MKKFETKFIFILVLLALLLSDVVATAQADEKETFTAFVETEGWLKMTVEHWMTTDEKQNLLQVFNEGGSEVMLKEILKMIVGYAWFTGTDAPRWQLHLASSQQTEEGRLVHLMTTEYSSDGKQHWFSVIEFILDEKGEGQGTIKKVKNTSINNDGNIEFEIYSSRNLLKVTKKE